MKIAIIGAGITGLTLALKLKNEDNSIEVFESDSQIGGLATYYDFKHFIWDKFYHVILPTDKELTGLIEDLGLTDDLEWRQTFTGVYVDKSFYSVSNSKEFLLYPPLNLWQKFRLGLTILNGARINKSDKLENITSEEWLIKNGGKTVYEKFWKPLLIAKLGGAYKKVSAVFIWSYIKRLFNARSDSDKKEAMGYVKGGYLSILNALDNKLKAERTQIHLNSTITNIKIANNKQLLITADKHEKVFDKVIFTAPVPVLNKVADPKLFETSGNLKQVEYLGVICNVLILKKQITPYYVLNIADSEVPFTGVIGMSTLVDTKQTGGYHLVYLPKYLELKDTYWEKSDEEIQQEFLTALMAMYPQLTESDVVDSFINKARVVQPLQVKDYSSIAPKVKTLHPGFYVVNSSQIMDSTLNNNSIATIANNFIRDFGCEFGKG